MLTHNSSVSDESYPNELKQILNMESAIKGKNWLSRWPLLHAGATPIYELPDLATRLGIARLTIKDEAQRSVLGSFKALGAPLALMRLISRWLPNLDPEKLLQGDYQKELDNFTVISATDGNHGRALAAAAQSIGCRCVIVLHAKVSNERQSPIEAYGAEIVRITGNYDDSVEHAAKLALANRWLVVSDTSYEGYEKIPRDVMQGYGIIAAELIEQTGQRVKPAFSHILLQGGVGGLAAGFASYLWEYYGKQRPRFIVVEPEHADCLFQSAIAGKPSAACSSVDSVMAGLACGQASPLAWRILERCIDDFMTISDDNAIQAMKLLATGSGHDIPLVSGESGAAGLAGLIALLQDPHSRNSLGLDGQSQVLLINTEGATAPSIYEKLVGESANKVLQRQMNWLNLKR